MAAAAAPPAGAVSRSGDAVAALTCAVQTNCHIADARHAADLTLCTYLLQMREFYRWEQGLPLGAPLERDAVGAWIAERERTWADLADHEFVALPGPAAPGACNPFDLDALRPQLEPLGLAYGAGLAGPDRPGFFLAELLETRRLADGVTVQVCGRERARGLFAPPAALLGDVVLLRRESLARWVWEKFESFSLKRADGAFKAVVDSYGLDRDFHRALPKLLDEQGEMLVLHELGEHRAGRWLEPAWAELRSALPNHRTELHVRAVRDLLADFEVTLPSLLDQDARASIHFWFATFDGVREALCPVLPAAYDAWREGDGGRLMRAMIARGREHFTRLAEQLLELHANVGPEAGTAIERVLTSPRAVLEQR